MTKEQIIEEIKEITESDDELFNYIKNKEYDNIPNLIEDRYAFLLWMLYSKLAW